MFSSTRLCGEIIIPVLDGVINTRTGELVDYADAQPALTLRTETGEFLYGGIPYPLGSAYMLQGGRINERSIRHKLPAYLRERVEAAQAARRAARSGSQLEGVNLPNGFRVRQVLSGGEPGEYDSMASVNGGYRVVNNPHTPI